MPNYNFHDLLEPLEFEKLICDIVQVREGYFVEMYKEGRDSGIDGSYIFHGKKTVIQAKRYKQNFKQLYNSLKDIELPKVRKLKPDRYILGVSITFQPGEKEQIIELFEGFITSTNDILSKIDINRLLEEPNYKWVELAHPKLWLPSINVFQKFLKESTHRALYKESAEELKEALKASNTFAPTRIYREALQRWSHNHVIVISGEPGVGKTTIAYLLALAYLQPDDLDGFIWAYSIKDVYNMLEDDKKQVIILDDFWGSIFHNESTRRNDENQLNKLIQRIIDFGGNKRLILTTREYVLRQGLQRQPMLKEKLEQYALICTVEEYSNIEKASILFQHLYSSNLHYEYVTYLFQNCSRIINHENYNPRVLALYLNKVPDKESAPEDYFIDLCDYFDNPGAFWEDIFLELSQEAQIVAMLLLISSTPMYLEDMKCCYAKYIDTSTNRMGIKKLSDSISELERTMIKSFYSDEEDEVLLKFSMPSVQDFLYSYIEEHTEQFIPELLQCCAYYNQLQFLLEHFSKGSSKQVIEMIERQCILHYEDYPYSYHNESDSSWNWGPDLVDDLPRGEEELHRFFHLLRCCDPHLHSSLLNFLESEIKIYCSTMGHGNIEAQYIDLHNLPDIIVRCTNKGMSFIGKDILNQFYKEAFSVYHYMAMEKFQEVFPGAYSTYHDTYYKKIKKELKTILLAEIELLDHLGKDMELDLLVDNIPEILHHFGLRYTDQFGEKVAPLCGREPLLIEKQVGVTKDYSIYNDEKEQSLEVVKQDAENWLFGPNEIELEDKQISELITWSDLRAPLKKELKEILTSNHSHYIHDYLETRESIQLLFAAIRDLERLPEQESSLCIILIEHIHQQNTNSQHTNLIGFCDEAFLLFMYRDEPVIRASEFLSSDIYNHYLKNDPALYEVVFDNLILQDSQWVRFLHTPIYTFCHAFITCIEFRSEDDSNEFIQEYWKEQLGSNSDKLKRTINDDKRTEKGIYYADFGTYYFKNYGWERKLYRMYEELDPFQFNRLYVGPRIKEFLYQLGYENDETKVLNFLSICEYQFYYEDFGAPHSSIASISDELSMFEHLNITKDWAPYPKQLSKKRFNELKKNKDICTEHNENWSILVYKIKDVELLRELGAYEEALEIIQELEKVHAKFSSGDYSSIL
ncbi:restriction endonuclease [Paenibacillus sp. NPDC093718]|uniref:nSTAND3 domain-containing NTPase n=1 Tax=Paenibacillus sp. NPDC093718 TaxID=3390601 RepID=UPI003CFE60C8